MSRLLIILILIAIFLGGGYWIYSNGYLAATPKPINADIAQIQSRGKLIVATDATYPPLEYLDTKGEIVGFDIDLADEIAKGMGVSLEIKNISFDKIFDALKNGEADLILSSVTITTERQNEMLFSAPYLNAGQVVVVVAGSEVKDQNGLSGKKVGVQKGTTSETEAKKLTDAKFVMAYADYDVAKADLIAGKIDAIVVDYPAAISMSQSSGGKLTVVSNPFTSEFYGVVAPLGKDGLIEFVDSVISRLKREGKLTEIEHLWFKR